MKLANKIQKVIKYFEALSLKITNDDRKKVGFLFLTAHTIVITIIMYLMLLTKKRVYNNWYIAMGFNNDSTFIFQRLLGCKERT